jgi:hypothetical protein
MLFRYGKFQHQVGLSVAEHLRDKGRCDLTQRTEVNKFPRETRYDTKSWLKFFGSFLVTFCSARRCTPICIITKIENTGMPTGYRIMNATAQILVNENKEGHCSLTSDVHNKLDFNRYLYKKQIQIAKPAARRPSPSG